MDAIVTSLYSRTMHLEVHNFMEIMGVAEYLQVSLLSCWQVKCAHKAYLLDAFCAAETESPPLLVSLHAAVRMQRFK